MTRNSGHGRPENGGRSKPGKLPLVQEPERGVDCLTCALCCTYIAVEIDPPSDVQNASEILWYLYHEDVSIYWEGEDRDEDWHVQFETRCRNLLPDNRCAIYAQRPMVCREYSEKTCEVNAPGPEGTTFAAPAEFLEYLRRKRPQLYTHLRRDYVPDREALAAHSPGHGGRSRLAPFRTRFRTVRDRAFPPG